MHNSLKIFLILFFLLSVAGFLFYKGIQEELNKHVFIQQSPLPSVYSSDNQILGEQNEAAVTTENTFFVKKVIDGDTIEVEQNGAVYRVRMIGVDTPETVHPTKSKQCFGQEASNKTKELLNGKQVILEKDVSETDQYDRLLRYVYVPIENSPNLLFVNDYLVREGYAQVLTYPPDVRFNEQFLEAQRIAKDQKKGLWGKCY